MSGTGGVSHSTYRPPTSAPNYLFSCMIHESVGSKESEPQAVTNGSKELSDSVTADTDLDGDFALLLKNAEAMKSIIRSKKCKPKEKHFYGEFNSLLKKIQPPEGFQLPSVGSASHDQGTCKPCMFNFKAGSCIKGMLCEFCHVGHNSKNKRKYRTGKPKPQKIKEKGQTPDELEGNSSHADHVGQNQMHNDIFTTSPCTSLPSTNLRVKTWNRVSSSIEDDCAPTPHACALQRAEVAEPPTENPYANVEFNDVGWISL